MNLNSAIKVYFKFALNILQVYTVATETRYLEVRRLKRYIMMI